MLVKTSRRRLTGAEQRWAEEGVPTLGRAPLVFSSLPPIPGRSPQWSLISRERGRATSKEK